MEFKAFNDLVPALSLSSLDLCPRFQRSWMSWVLQSLLVFCFLEFFLFFFFFLLILGRIFPGIPLCLSYILFCLKNVTWISWVVIVCANGWVLAEVPRWHQDGAWLSEGLAMIRLELLAPSSYPHFWGKEGARDWVQLPVASDWISCAYIIKPPWKTSWTTGFGELLGWWTHWSAGKVLYPTRAWKLCLSSLHPCNPLCISSIWLFLSYILYNNQVMV